MNKKSMNREKSLKQAYQKLLDVGFGEGSLEETSEFITKDVMGYGTAQDEKIMTLEEFNELIKNQRKQAVNFDDISFSSNPVKIKFLNHGNVALVVDEIEINTQIKNESNTLFLRMTTIFEYGNESWKLIHWHSSTADHVSGGEDPWHADEWKKKTEMLEQMVEEKTAELFKKNNELEIEAALEKVRSSALVMKNPADMVDVCNVISDQLELLGVKDIRNVQTVIINEQKTSYLNYQYFAAYKKGIIEDTDYIKHPTVSTMVEEMKKSANSTFSGIMTGKELITFREWRKQYHQFPDPILDEVDSAYYYFYSIGLGGLGLTTYKPLSKEGLNVFKRFHNVFTLAYRRFIDIEKAIAQAREAQVEAALERIRSLALGMRKSEEVGNVTDRLFKELINLSVDVKGGSIVVIDEEIDKMELWRARSNIAVKPVESTSFTESMNLIKKYLPDWFPNFIKALRKRKNYLMDELSGDRRSQFINVIAEQYKYSDEEKSQLLKNTPEKITTYYIFFKLGYLALLGEKKLSEENLSIARRFVEVFEFSYTRFLDIKNAEARTREAQIEVGLERARAQSMMMQHSEELNKTSQVFHEQLYLLGIESEFSYLWLPDEVKMEHLFWATWQEGADGFKNKQVIYPLDKSEPAIAECYLAWESDLPVHVNPVLATGVEEYFNTWSKLLKGVDKFKPELYPDGLYYVDAYMKYGCFGIMIRKQLSEDQLQVLNRFSREFERAYTRFLDLKKAEAQAREAQIESALERVRSRSLAMHHSSELSAVVDTLFKEFTQLEFTLTFCIINLIDGEDRSNTVWAANPETGRDAESYYMKFEDYDFHRSMWNAWKAQDKRFVYTLEGEEKKIYDEYLYSQTEFRRFPKHVQEANKALDRYVAGFTFFKYSGLQTVSENEITDAELKILERFGRVFEQAYTRFLDLQKAEAQTREAKIEAALEKVRSRTMGMQKGEELQEVAVLLYKELIALGVTNFVTCGYVEIHEKTNRQYTWVTSPGGDTLGLFYLPLTGDATFDERYAAWKRQQLIFHQTVEGEERSKHLEYAITTFQSKEAEEMVRNQFPDPTVFYCFNFSHGYLHLVTGSQLNHEEEILVARFTKVFEQTYTRFLDLLKAEAQAREAQIELSLERIRAQVTAMRESSELLDIVVTMRSEFVSLGHEAHYFWHMRWLPDKYEKAMTSGDGTRIGMVMSLPRHIHGDIAPVADWEKSDKPICILAMDVETAVEYVDKMITLGDFEIVDPQAPSLDDIRHIGGLTFVMARTTHGEIGFSLPGTVPNPPKDALDTLVRFAGVFDLAYKRFEDLKSAEHRHREAQIELAMEKVRARALAMQKPEELIEVAQVLRTEMGLLGVEELETSSIYIHDEDSGTTECWYAIKDIREEDKKLLTDHMTMHLNDIWVGREMIKFYRSDQNQTSILMQGENRKEWINYCAEHSEALQGYYGDVIPERTYHLLKFSNGFIGAASPGEISAQSWELLEKATSVFSFAYTRFRDLQQSETRAIEAMRQASLDRVRAEIASMRSTDDLEKITPLIWRELTALGVPFFRCGVFIIDETNELVHAYLSTPEGNSLAALQIKLDKGVWVEKAVQNWRMGQMYYEIWDREKFLSWTQVMMDEGFVDNKERFQDGEDAPEKLSLQLLPFNQGMLYIGSEERLSEEAIELGQKLANDFGIAYSRYEDFQKLEAANHRKSLELEEARQLQLSMLPNELPKTPNLDIAVYMQTATEVGGDYYDFNVGENGELTAVIGDATGHGMKAGTIVTITKSLFNSFASSKNILDTFNKISKVIKDMKFRQLAMCLLMLKINENKLMISSAAMPPALIYRKKKKLVEEIESKGMPLGAMENFPYKIKNTLVDNGDTILLMSDGLPELHNGTNEMYGYDRIMNEFKSVGNRAPQEIINHLKKSAAEWINGNDPDDDITFVVIKVK